MNRQDRYRGCLVGGGAGDALGYAVEFASEATIFADYGREGITYSLRSGARMSSVHRCQSSSVQGYRD